MMAKIGIGMTLSKTEFGKCIRDRRIERGLAQFELARDVGIDQASLSSLEIKGQYPRKKTLFNLAECLQLEYTHLESLIPLKPPKYKLGRYILRRLNKLGKTIDDFAKELGITYQRARDIIYRQAKIRYFRMAPLAKALGVNQKTLANFMGINTKKSPSIFGQNVRYLRIKKGLSQKQLAKTTGVSKQLISQVELGLTPLSNNLAEKLSRIFGIDPAELKSLKPKRKIKRVKRDDPLGYFLSEKRIEARLTQAQLAKLAEVNPSTILHAEKGILHNIDLLNKIAGVLKCRIPEVLLPGPKSTYDTEQIQKGAA